jgi:hypothetical protein
MKTFVEQVDQLAPVDLARVEKLLPEELRRDVADSGNFAWLPLQHNLVLTRAVAESLGPKRTHEFFVELMLSTYRTPLLKSLVDAVLRLQGNDLGTMLQWVSKGFELMFKDVGHWRVVEREASTASLEVLGLPAIAFSDRIWLESVCSSVSSLFSLAEVTGLASLRDLDPERAGCVIRLRWEG